MLDFETGKEIGEHKGLWFHTIGQRKGLGQATAKFTHLGPWFVPGPTQTQMVLTCVCFTGAVMIEN